MSWIKKLLGIKPASSEPRSSWTSNATQSGDSDQLSSFESAMSSLMAGLGQLTSDFKQNFLRLLTEIVPNVSNPLGLLNGDDLERARALERSEAFQAALTSANEQVSREEGVVALSQLGREHPASVAPALALSDALESTAEIVAAERVLVAALPGVAEKSAVLERLALLFEGQGDYAKATAYHLLAANASRPGSRAWQSFRFLAALYRERGDADRARGIQKTADKIHGGAAPLLDGDKLKAIQYAMATDPRISEIANWAYPSISDAVYYITNADEQSAVSDVAEEPVMAAAVGTGAPSPAAAPPATSETTDEPEMGRWKEIFKEEIIRFLTTSRTRTYEQQTGAWWSHDDLKLVVAKKFSADLAADHLFPLAESAIDELVKENKITGTPSGYRAR
jgi:tetratricopeptide (TPR) repeat protein